MVPCNAAASRLLPLERADVFFDGLFSTPRLQHPEAVAVAPDGAAAKTGKLCGSPRLADRERYGGTATLRGHRLPARFFPGAWVAGSFPARG